MKPTFCRDCDHVVEDTRKRSPHQWLCGRHKRLEGQGFVDPDLWIETDPFLRCKDVNGGACELFDPRRMPKDGR